MSTGGRGRVGLTASDEGATRISRKGGVCAGAQAWVLSGTKGPTQALRMKASRRHPLSLGGVDCRLLQYEVRPPPPAAAQHHGSAPGRQHASAA